MDRFLQYLMTFTILLNCNQIKSLDNKKIDERAIEFNNKATDCVIRGKQDSALYFINRAIEIDSNYYLAYNQKVMILMGLKRNNEALATAKKISRFNKDTISMIEGMVLESIGKLDKAKDIYKRLIINKNYFNKNYLLQIDYAILVTIVYGKDKGFEELKIIKTDSLSDYDKHNLKTFENQIKVFEGGGYNDMFLETPKKHFCIKTNKSSEELDDYLLDHGINTLGLSSDGKIAEIDIQIKFEDKVKSLGFKECEQIWNLKTK